MIAQMTDTPRSNAVSPVVFMGSGGPDLTAPEAVERADRFLSGLTVTIEKGFYTTTKPCPEAQDALATLRALSAALTQREGVIRAQNYDYERAIAERDALSAQLLDVSKREAAMIARYDAKLEAAEAKLARADLALLEIDALDPEGKIDGCSQAALRGLVLRMGEIARDARAFLASIGDKT